MHLFPSPYNPGPQACEGLGKTPEARFSIFIIVSAFLHLLVLCSCIDWRRDTAGPLLAGNAVIEIDLVSIPGPDPTPPAPATSVTTEEKMPSRKASPHFFQTSADEARMLPIAPIVEKAPPPTKNTVKHMEAPAPVKKTERTPVGSSTTPALPSSGAADDTQRSASIPAAIGNASLVSTRNDARAEGPVAANATGTSAPVTATASPGDLSPGQGYVDENFYYIKDLITRNLTYPVLARRMKWQGTVVVSFVVSENGEAGNIRVVTGSGHSILDKNVIAAIEQVQPFPIPPAAAEFTMPIKYSLRH
jgi:protein TonB